MMLTSTKILGIGQWKWPLSSKWRGGRALKAGGTGVKRYEIKPLPQPALASASTCSFFTFSYTFTSPLAVVSSSPSSQPLPPSLFEPYSSPTRSPLLHFLAPSPLLRLVRPSMPIQISTENRTPLPPLFVFLDLWY